MLPTFDFITALKFASHAMATNDARYYLNGCDGLRTAKVRLNLKGCRLSGDYIVKCESVKDVLRTVKTKQTDTSPTRIEPADDKSGRLLLFARDGGCTLALEVQDGRYPDFERAVPQSDPKGCPTIRINADYLGDAARALKPLIHSNHKALTIDTWEANSCMRLRCKPDAAGLTAIDGEAVVHIMPMVP